MVLFIDACVREEASRTKWLAEKLLKTLENGEHKTVNLAEEELLPLTKGRLEQRDWLISEGKYDDEMFRFARDFAVADTIVIAAPYWDLTFPAILKLYLENIYVTGLVSTYGEDGMPKGLCKGQKLYYVTTAGGPYNGAYSYELLKDMAQNYFGIPEVELIMADMLDVDGFDAEKILAECLKAHGLR